MKLCRGCGEEKSLEDFGRQADTQDGRARRCRACMAKYHQARQEADPDYRRRKHLQARYGLTLEAYEAMLDAQGGGCAICGSVPGARSLHVDHDHSCCPGSETCGECIRGLLCDDCNRGLGSFQDQPGLLDVAASYLRSHLKEN